MKIGTIHTLYGRRAGAEMYFERIVNGLTANDAGCSFLVFCNRQAFDVLPSGHPQIQKVFVPWLDRQVTKAFWLEFLAAKQVDGAGLDLFWIPSGANNFPGRWQTPSVVTILDVGEYFVRGKYDWKRTWYRKHVALPRSVGRACRITTISHNAADALAGVFSLKNRPAVVYPGPSPRRTSDTTRDPAAVVRLETGREFPASGIVLTPARTDYIGKGLDVLLDAYESCLDSMKEVPPLVLVGPEGEGHARLARRLERAPLQGRAVWLGRVSDECVDALYALSRMLVLPSRYEGFGFPVLEAMQHGVPVICSDAGSLPEVTGEGGLCFASGDASALANSIERVLSDDALAGQLKERGRRRLAEFSWESTLAGMSRVFQECRA